MGSGKVDAPRTPERVSPHVVLNVVLESGERLPCLVDRTTWIPVRGVETFALDELSAQRAPLEQVFRFLRRGGKQSQRFQPHSENELASLRRELSPKTEAGQDWFFPKGFFYRHAQLRNWLMVETG